MRPGSIYEHAIAKHETNEIVVRRFEAYCKLYRATARGIRRADPTARIGGPALASGPMENSKDCGHCARGQGFARGLMIWCVQEKLPLDFVSWHEYFQPNSTSPRSGRSRERPSHGRERSRRIRSRCWNCGVGERCGREGESFTFHVSSRHSPHRASLKRPIDFICLGVIKQSTGLPWQPPFIFNWIRDRECPRTGS